MAESFADAVYELVRQVPRGRIVSYGGVAALLGRPRAARAVGQALRALPDDNDVPWWRVVNSTGAVSNRPVINARPLQQALLRKERIRFDRSGRASWDLYGWTGPKKTSPEKTSPEKTSDDSGRDRKNARKKTRNH